MSHAPAATSVAVLTLALSLAAPTPARATLVLATSQSEVGGVNFSDWSVAGALGTDIPTPFTVTTSDQTRVTVSAVHTNGVDQFVGPFRYDYLDATGRTALIASQSGILTYQSIEAVFDFESPVTAFGVELYGFASIAIGLINVDAFDANGHLLGHFNIKSGVGAGPAVFLGYAGVVSDAADISQVRFQARSSPGGFASTAHTRIAVFSMDVNAPATTATPAPPTLALLTAAAALGGLTRLGARARQRGLAPRHQ